MNRSTRRGCGSAVFRRLGWCLVCELLLGSAMTLAAPPSNQEEVAIGSLELQLNVALLADYGAELVDAPAARDAQDSYLRWPAASLSGDLKLQAAGSGPPRAQQGRARFAAGLTFKRPDGALLRLNRLLLQVPVESGEWALTDSVGKTWFTARAGFPLSAQAERLQTVVLIDLQASKALAKWLDRPNLAGESVGRMSLALRAEPVAKGGPSCPLNWPGTPGFTVDVALVDLYQLQAQCVIGNCDGGASGSSVPRVKLTPATNLRNVGSADVPWVGKFLSLITASQLELTHPYPQPDQHPMLVWNAYRLDADGRITQIGRSGLKHAFATENLGCTCNPDNHQILGPQCSDRYDIGSNDFSNGLAPRSEVIAADGRWGRCGSLFDPDCIGSQTFTDTSISHRLLLTEADIDSNRHPTSRWFVDAWYVVRDDSNVLNTMGWREFLPRYINNVWQTSLTGAYNQGALLGEWAGLPFNGDGWSLFQRVQTATGELQLAVRVLPLAAGRARYEYALLNHSVSRPQVTGAEPNLRVLSNPGVVEVTLPLGATRVGSVTDNHAGDVSTPWTPDCADGNLRLTAPASESLAWGSMLRWSVIADGPPQKGTVRVRASGDSNEAAILAPSLVPGPAPGAIFADGFARCG
ncbi:MAG: hypothetical protein ACT4NL_13170 [Pseudomarimonas sp.]